MGGHLGGLAGLESLVGAVELGVRLLDQGHPQGPVPARARGVTQGNQTQTHTGTETGTRNVAHFRRLILGRGKII